MEHKREPDQPHSLRDEAAFEASPSPKEPPPKRSLSTYWLNLLKQMNIHRKMYILVVSFVVIPLGLLIFISSFYMGKQFQAEQEKYLLSTLTIARSEMKARRLDIEKACLTISQDPDLLRAVQNKDTKALVGKIRPLRVNFDKVDYAVVVDKNNQLLARSDISMLYLPDSVLADLAQQALDSGKSISSNEKIPLKELYVEGSNEYKKFAIKLSEGFAGEAEYLHTCLSEVTVVPIVDQTRQDKASGAIILAGIANSDYYFPEYVSAKTTDGFLVLTVDGVRVATKATVGEDKNWLVGTRAVTAQTKALQDKFYLSAATLKGLNYLFLDQPLENSKGETVGYITLGMPEERLNDLVIDNRKLAVFIAIICMLIFLPLGQILASQQQKHSDKLTYLVRERTRYLEQAVAELRELDKVKSQFLSNLSHELRTPLSVIINACDILKGKYFGDLNDKQLKNVQSALDCANHLLNLINDLLDVSKMNAGKLPLSYQKLSIKALVSAALANVSGLTAEKDLQVKLLLQPEDFTICADPQRLQQIFYNLLSNAIKFTRDGGHIEVRIYKRDRFMEAIVRDDGIGIAPADQERVFNEFEQVDTSYTKRYKGTGLGLPIVKKLVEMHGGQVSLNSKLGGGTEVIFTLPLEH
jgi:signal transduction histidine kinase